MAWGSVDRTAPLLAVPFSLGWAPHLRTGRGAWLGCTVGCGSSSPLTHPCSLTCYCFLPQPPGKALTGRSVGPSSALPGDPYNSAVGPADFEISPLASSDSGEGTWVRAPERPLPSLPHSRTEVSPWPPPPSLPLLLPDPLHGRKRGRWHVDHTATPHTHRVSQRLEGAGQDPARARVPGLSDAHPRGHLSGAGRTRSGRRPAEPLSSA